MAQIQKQINGEMVHVGKTHPAELLVFAHPGPDQWKSVSLRPSFDRRPQACISGKALLQPILADGTILPRAKG